MRKAANGIVALKKYPQCVAENMHPDPNDVAHMHRYTT